MTRTKYFFQQRKLNLAKSFFEKGLNASTYLLFALKEAGEGFLTSLPDCYPQFALMKQLFGVGKYKKRAEVDKKSLGVNLERLKKQGLVAQDPKKKTYYLTEQGKKFTAYIEDRYALLAKAWDGKLRIVLFDIPEQKRRWRYWLRKELELLQFQQLQKSVYLGKTSLPESFYKEIVEAGLDKNIFVLTVGEIDKREEVLKLFEE